jgi:phytoene dehydrogenase-like protein
MPIGVDDFDVVIVGAGHNGLVCAAYLAMAGMRVKVVERRHVVGGAAVTEEFCPGFRNSVAAYTVSLLHPKIIRELRLHEHGLRIVERRVQNFLPGADGSYLIAAEGQTERQIAKFSAADASRYAAFNRELDAAADILRDLALRPPPNLTSGLTLRHLGELIRTGALAHRLRRLPAAQIRLLFDLATKSAGEVLDGWFESDLIKAMHGFDSVVGNYASPYTPGTAYVLLHHAFGEVNGRKRSWGHALGGMGAITQAMAHAAQSLGVAIETGAPVAEIMVERARACGVVLGDGRVIRAGAVAANVNPRLLYTMLLPSESLPAEFLARMRRWRCESGTFRMNVALSCLPSFSALPTREAADHLTAGIILGPSLGYMERAFHDARRDGWSREPIIEMLIPSTLDETLSPPSAHVASLFCQHVAPQLPDGKSWRDHRDTVADLIIDTVERYAPGFKASVVGRQALSPLDLEETFGLTGGDIFHGALSLDQLFWARPMIGYADYRGPLRGLYHCGSGAHPGGGVTGLPGHNAARAILRDRRWSFWT